MESRVPSDLATRRQAVVGDAYRIARELGGGGKSVCLWL